MFCRICGEKIPDDSLFCPRCGREVIPLEAAAPAEHPASGQEPGAAPAAAFQTQVFTFPDNTTYDQASVPVNDWLSQRGVHILDARFTLEPSLLAGTVVPLVERLELDWTAEETKQRYQLGVMLDSRGDFGLGRKKGAAALQRQFDRWQAEHPEYEIAAKQDCQLSLGWTSAWAILFFYR